MTEHLPECPCVHHPSEHLWCICERLRACEERMLTTYLARDNFEAGLDAAREAVKHLQHSDDCYYAEGVLCHCEIKRVITAIDALRKEPQ